MQRSLLAWVVPAFLMLACDEGRVRNRQVPSDLDRSVVVPASAGGVGSAGAIPNGPGTVAHADRALGTPTFLWADAPSAAVLREREAMSATDAARAYLADYAARFRLDPQVAKSAREVSVHDLGEGAVVVQLTRDAKITTFEGERKDAEVFRDRVKLVMNQQHALVAIAGSLTPQAQKNVASARLRFAQSPQSAVAFALTDLTGIIHTEEDLALASANDRFQELSLTGSTPIDMPTPALVKHVVFPTATSLEPAYDIELDVRMGAEGFGFAYVISAADGRVLFRKNASDAAAGEAPSKYRVYATEDGFPLDGPFGDITPHPTADPSTPAPQSDVPSRLLAIAHGPISTGDPWLAPNAAKLSGNNVYAFANVKPAQSEDENIDGFQEGDIDVEPTSPGVFDRAHKTGVNPAGSVEQIKAATTNLFYVVNFLHDWYYDAGFTEKDGNAQLSNYGRGGVEGDPLMAQAQDASGRNNANMSTPADGRSPTMRMYIFTSKPTLTLSGGFSAQEVRGASFGALDYDLPAQDLVLVRDDAAPTSDGCSGLVNGETVGGRIAVIERGTCGFALKAQNAQAAGALAIVFLNNQPGPIVPGGEAPDVTIPAVAIDQASGALIKAALEEGQAIVAKLERGPKNDRDGTLDTLVVAHEWGHYISNRLVYDSRGLNTAQARGLGEGWADFHALLLTVKESDAQLPGNEAYAGAYAQSIYVSGASSSETRAYYAGMRRTPYSTNFEINPLTFKYVANGEALPPLARGYTFGDDGADNFEVHSAGEIWAQMLWECYVALLNDEREGLSFAEKQERMKRLLIAAYKATPAQPTFLEARDAVLAAALATNPGYYEAFWKAFARRGAGIRAQAPEKTSADGSGVRESFKIGPDLAIVKAELKDAQEQCSADGIFDDGETLTLSVTLKNVGIGRVKPKALVASPTLGLLIDGGGLLDFSEIGPLESATATVQVRAEALAAIARVDLDVTASDPSLAVPAVSERVSFMANFDVASEASTSDDVEAPISAWTVTHGSGAELANEDWFRAQLDVEQTAWYGNDVATTADLSLVSPALQVASDKDFTLRFKHTYALEKAEDPQTHATTAFDGGVIELSLDGNTWTDVGEKASPGYTDTLVAEDSKNPLAGRKAYSGTSEGFPAFQDVSVAFGREYAGKTVYVRFRVGCDQGARAFGWLIDDVAVEGVTNKPFSKRVKNAAQSCPQ